MEDGSNENLKDAFEKELKAIESETVMSPEYRKKKLIIWAIRTALAVALFVYLWDHQWVRWALWFYIPLNLLSLGMLFATPHFLKKKMERTRTKIEGLDDVEE